MGIHMHVYVIYRRKMNTYSFCQVVFLLYTLHPRGCDKSVRVCVRLCLCMNVWVSKRVRRTAKLGVRGVDRGHSPEKIFGCFKFEVHKKQQIRLPERWETIDMHLRIIEMCIDVSFPGRQYGFFGDTQVNWRLKFLLLVISETYSNIVSRSRQVLK